MSNLNIFLFMLLLFLFISCSNDSKSPTDPGNGGNYNPNGHWSDPIFVSNNFENKYNPSISGDGKTLYCDSYEGMSGYKIYYSLNDGNGWSQLYQFSITNYQQPCISYDGNKIFISDDWSIYVANKINSVWSQPDSILEGREPSITQDGKTLFYTKDIIINMECRIFYASLENNVWVEKGGIAEVDLLGNVWDPAISGDGTLLFFTRSDGAEYNIYYTRKVNNVWQTPQILGNEINFTYENNSPCVSWDKMKLYYSTYTYLGSEPKDGIYMATWVNE
jgi:hypothetical protein